MKPTDIHHPRSQASQAGPWSAEAILGLLQLLVMIVFGMAGLYLKVKLNRARALRRNGRRNTSESSTSTDSTLCPSLSSGETSVDEENTEPIEFNPVQAKAENDCGKGPDIMADAIGAETHRDSV